MPDAKSRWPHGARVPFRDKNALRGSSLPVSLVSRHMPARVAEDVRKKPAGFLRRVLNFSEAKVSGVADFYILLAAAHRCTNGTEAEDHKCPGSWLRNSSGSKVCLEEDVAGA